MNFYIFGLAFFGRFAYNRPKFGEKDDGYACVRLQKQGRASH